MKNNNIQELHIYSNWTKSIWFILNINIEKNSVYHAFWRKDTPEKIQYETVSLSHFNHFADIQDITNQFIQK